MGKTHGRYCDLVGGRDGSAAMDFIDDLASRLANRVQIKTDGHKAYLDAIDTAFGGEPHQKAGAVILLPNARVRSRRTFKAIPI
jgi:hypothetical protein